MSDVRKSTTIGVHCSSTAVYLYDHQSDVEQSLVTKRTQQKHTKTAAFIIYNLLYKN